MRSFTVAFALLVVLGASCARVATPNAPFVTTAAGHRCVQQCQSLHRRCIMRANGKLEVSFGDYVGPRNRQISACNDSLGSCYATCPS